LAKSGLLPNFCSALIEGMRIFVFLSCLLCGMVAADPVQTQDVNFEESFRQEVSAFLNLMDQEQAEKVVLPVDEKKDGGRWQMRYTGGERLGLKIGELNKKQRKQLEGIMKLVLSDYGGEMMKKVIAQDGEEAWKNYYVVCFGDPRKGEDFAFRFGEHHVTLVWLELAQGEVKEFGPILWGSDPPALWLDEEKDLIKVWAALTEEEKEKVLVKSKKGIASKAIKKGEGVLISELNKEALTAISKMMERRFSVFSPALKKKVMTISLKEGGASARVAFYGQPALKSCQDGGRWDFKIGNDRVNTDFENSRGHIHMSLWVKPE